MSDTRADDPAPSENRQKTGTSKAGKAAVWLIALAVLAAGAALAFFWRPSGDEQGGAEMARPLVETAQVTQAPEALFVTQTAFVSAVDSIPVVAEVSGRVASINPDFAVGSSVSQGDVLFEIVDDRYQADVARARAQVRQAEAQLVEAEETLSRQTRLQDDNFASEAALQGARTAQAQAQGNLDLANAQLTTAQIALSDTTVRAPFDAVVTAQSLSPGQLIQPADPVGEIAVNDFVEINVGLTEDQFALLTRNAALTGRSATVTPRRVGPVMGTMPDRTGTVRAVSPVLDPQSRTVEVTVRAPRQPQGKAALQFNQLVQVGFPLPAADDVLWRAPRQALLGGQTIWRVTPDDALTRLDATITRQTDDWIYFTAPIDGPADVLVTALDAPVAGMQVRRETDVSEASP